MTQNYDTLLISDELLKLYSPVREDDRTLDFTPYVRIAQEQYIKPILGDALYYDLLDQICEGELSPEYSRLVIAIAPALANLSYYVALPFRWADFSNKGVTLEHSENSDAAGVKDIAQLRAWTLDISNQFLAELRRFLHEHKEDYPLYREDCDCDGDHDNGVAYPHASFVKIRKTKASRI